jgi:hypothetical protein
MFLASGYINTIDDRLKYINEMEQKRIMEYGINYMEYIETVYYDNDINESINSEYCGISLDELINIVLRMDMAINEESMKYIDGLIYDIGGIEIWEKFGLVDKIRIYQLLSVIKKTFGINELNQLHNVSKSLSLSLLDRRYDTICYIKYNNKITNIGILFDDEKIFLDMMKNDLCINKQNIKYLQQLLYIDADHTIIDMINSDFVLIGVYIGDLNDKQIIYWRWKYYRNFNEYFMGHIYDRNYNAIDYTLLISNNNSIDDDKNNKIVTRDCKTDTKRRRLLEKRKRNI